MKDHTTEHASTSKPAAKGNIIEQLRVEAKRNPCLNDVLHIFAVRERARQQVTLAALMQTMAREGFSKYTAADYTTVLSFLNKLGIGRLDVDSKGNVRSLKDIKITLQSLGMAGVSKAETFQTFVPRNRYMHLVPHKPEAATSAPAMPPKQMFTQVRLTAIINGAPVAFNIADHIEATDLGEILAGLYADKKNHA